MNSLASNTPLNGTPVSEAPATSSEPVNMFETMVANPIKVSRLQSNGVLTGPAANTKSIHYSLANFSVFQSLPKETARGVDDLTRMEMALLSGIPEEIKWSLKKYLTYSNKAPYMISLRTLPDLLPLFKTFILPLERIVEGLNKSSICDSKAMDSLQMGLNALLILRNLAQDTDSVQILVKDREIKSFILFILKKFQCVATGDNKWQLYEGNATFFNELTHYTLDLMEAISSYIAPAMKDDHYFQTLVSILNYTKDRYMVISILRSLSRLLVRSKANEESAADNLDHKTLSLIVSFLLLECDSELIIASLDFLYQYILPGSQRITELFKSKECSLILEATLPNLLSYNIATPDYHLLQKHKIRLIKRLKPPAPKEPPNLSEDLFQQLFKLNEPLRSTAWLRCCFEPVQEAEFTQISLWRSYESKFGQPVRESGRKLLPAVEFIKNVSNAFNNAAAIVITDPVTGKKRFVIKGIQPRFKALGIADGERESQVPISALKSKFLNDSKEITPARQNSIPEVKFPQELSDVSKVACTFLCLLSNDTDDGAGSAFCQRIRPLVLHKLADIPPLTLALSEYMENTSGL